MADFVDYKKRSVTLPSGCKDLSTSYAPRGPALAPQASAAWW